MVKYVKIIETTVGQKGNFEERINQAADVLNSLGCTTVTYFSQTFGLSPMVQQVFMVYTRPEGYVSHKEYEKAYKEYMSAKKGETSKKEK